MFKKAMSLLVAMVLVLTATAAFASELYKVEEDYDAFDIEMAIPDGYTHTQFDQEGWIQVLMESGDPAKANYSLHISPSELFTGLSLADLDDGDMEFVMESIEEVFTAPESEEITTPSGNLVVFTNETDESGSFATVQTLYRGFWIYLYCAHEDFAPLADEDLELLKEITYGLQIEPMAEPMMPPAEEETPAA